MLKTFAKLATLDTGFEKDQVLLIRVDPRYASVPLDRRLSPASWSTACQRRNDTGKALFIDKAFVAGNERLELKMLALCRMRHSRRSCAVQTTERYLGTKQDLAHSPDDGIKLAIMG
jgi:hypothetical protein